MISKTKIDKLSKKKFRNKTYEKMTLEELKKIRNSLTKEDIIEKEILLQSEINKLAEYGHTIIPIKDIENLNKLDLLNRYKTASDLHHRSIQIREKYNSKKYKEFFCLELFEKFYEKQRILVILIKYTIKKLVSIKKSKIGINDLSFKKEEKFSALVSSLMNIDSFVQGFTIESNFVDKLKYNLDLILNINKKESDNLIYELIDKLQENDLNYINDNKSNLRYEFLEQLILAPLHILQLLDDDKFSNKNNLNKANLTKEDISNSDSHELNKKLFYNIERNQIIAYCATIFYELFSLDYHNIKKIYSYFYSESEFSYAHTNKNSSFLKNPFIHIYRKKDFIYECFIIPPEISDFERIFYEVSPDNFDRKKIERLEQESRLEVIMINIHEVKSIDDIPNIYRDTSIKYDLNEKRKI